MPLRAYLIFYRVTGETVEILRVLHSARDVGDVLLQALSRRLTISAIHIGA